MLPKEANQRMNVRTWFLGLVLVAAGCESEIDAPSSQDAGLPGAARADLDPIQRAAFDRGRQLFTRVFDVSSGLGPYYNDSSCLACHDNPTLGGQGDFEDRIYVGLSEQAEPDVENFQHSAIPGFGVRSRPADTTRRMPPPLFGLGLLESVPEDVLRAAGCHEGSFVLINGRVARFGTKAFAQTLRGVVSSALFDEMGITNLVEEDDTLAAVDTDSAPDPEVDDSIVRDLTSFVQGLAPPPTLPANPRGARLFADFGCATCHRPETGPGVPAFTDLCMHSMGAILADGIISHARNAFPRTVVYDGDEFRTPALWGLRFRPRLLHDGRSTTVDEAIRLHGGEAAATTQRYSAASAEERALLLAYLGTI